ncbi:hypothetical protein [Mobilicoccus massiliensis]|uniref:hypothetical protein n=1 Tax=Mobilicoccus massiliensis TaxID=1522310 RepID=UPI00058B9B8C|nr:hypothetical protein [Mobilicoccus massiliensis]
MSRCTRGLTLLVLTVSLAVGAPMPASAGALASATAAPSAVLETDNLPERVPDWVCQWFPRLCRM